MGFFLGIDGGGTKTECVLADEAGVVLAEASGRGSNLRRVPPSELHQIISGCVKQLQGATGLRRMPFDAVCAGFAGGGLISAREAAGETLAALLHPHRLFVVSDIDVALEAAVGPGEGVVLIAGTGSIAYGRNSLGRQARAGGEGPPVGDVGSGYDIGRRALEAVVEAARGRGPATVLSARVSEILGSSTPQSLENFLGPEQAGELAALLPAVVSAARAGDAVADSLLMAAADELARLVETVLERLALANRRVRVATTGGVFRASPEVWDRVGQRLARVAPQAEVTPLPVSPAVGAVRLATRLWLQEQGRGSAVLCRR